MPTADQYEQAITDYLADVLYHAMADSDDEAPRHYTVQSYDADRHEAVIVWDADQSCTPKPETTYLDLAMLDKAFDVLAGANTDQNLTEADRDHLYGSYCDLWSGALDTSECRAIVEIAAFGRLVFSTL